MFAAAVLKLMKTKFIVGLAGILLLAGCAHYEAKPLSPAQTAAQLESRSLTNQALQVFLEQHLKERPAVWPPARWDFEMLTLAAFYYHPSLEVARAQWRVVQGGETTAAQRPNPTLNVTPGYNMTTVEPYPWFPLGSLDVPIETAGKRGYRRAQAAHLSEAARLNIVSAAWRVRTDLRASLLELHGAAQRATLLHRQLEVREQAEKLAAQQIQAGAIPASEGTTFRTAAVKVRVDLADTDRQIAEARTKVAEAVGVPLAAIEAVTLGFDWLKMPESPADLTSAELRQKALLNRPDILAALAEYAASQSALQLEIAKQYPDIHLQPGYEFDQGDSKWSLGLTMELPIINQNQGPIAEARARREEVAARFNALQVKVLADIERATTSWRAASANVAALQTLAGAQQKQLDAIEAQFQAGAAERMEVVRAQAELQTVELLQFEAQWKLQQAVGILEDTVVQPLNLASSISR
jgi:outer membrane protein TolC